jgi:mono/diheme cytochrome c family protein
MKHPSIALLLGFLATACTTTSNPLEDYEELTPARMMTVPTPESGSNTTMDPEKVEQGRYLVELIGCGVCHTNGALLGEPDFDEWLGGSDAGIAYSNPLKNENPGVVFPPNLTPDRKTGIGQRTDEEIVNAMRHGLDHYGLRLKQVMPWLVYTAMSDDDARAIVAYLRSLPPIDHKVPDNVTPGIKTDKLFVHFGVYRSRR